MKLTYAQAIIRYSFDLTDPEARNVPIAALLIARADEGKYAAAVAGFKPFVVDSIDEISASMLDDLPQVIKRHVDEAFRAPNFREDIIGVLVQLQHDLRNTLNVCEIIEAKEVSIDDAREVGGKLTRIVTETLLSKAFEEGVLEPPKKALLGLGKSRLETGRWGSVPSQNFWAIQEDTRPMAVAG